MKSDWPSNSSKLTERNPSVCSSSTESPRGSEYRIVMSKPRARRATACPIRPMPTMPSVLPLTAAPARWFDCEPGNTPERTTRSPSTIRRATASSSPNAISAVASVTTAGMLVTMILRVVASVTSIRSGVIVIEATAFRFGLAASTSRSMVSCSRHRRMSERFAASISLSLTGIRLESSLSSTSAISFRRSSALSAIGWVT